jgi:hypothetical protein
MAFQYLQAAVSIVNGQKKNLIYSVACTVMNMINALLMVYEIVL